MKGGTRREKNDDMGDIIRDMRVLPEYYSKLLNRPAFSHMKRLKYTAWP